MPLTPDEVGVLSLATYGRKKQGFNLQMLFLSLQKKNISSSNYITRTSPQCTQTWAPQRDTGRLWAWGQLPSSAPG